MNSRWRKKCEVPSMCRVCNKATAHPSLMWDNDPFKRWWIQGYCSMTCILKDHYESKIIEQLKEEEPFWRSIWGTKQSAEEKPKYTIEISTSQFREHS